MKIAISSDGSDLDSKVTTRFSTAEYLVIIDIDSGEFEAVQIPVTVRQRGVGIQALVLAVNKGAKAVITGYCNPAVANQMKTIDVEILAGVTGTVRDAIEQYKKFLPVKASENQPNSMTAMINEDFLIHAARNAARQFFNLLPILIGVVLLIGLFDVFVSEESLTSIFSGNVSLDTFWGVCFGSIFAGNPINSYVIGGQLLKYGVSLFAVTAFIVAWVTVGLVQLPAEIAAFGKRFALLRNGLSFLLAIPIAILTVLILNLLERWIS